MLYMFNLMKESEQQQFYAQITAKMAEKGFQFDNVYWNSTLVAEPDR